MSEKGHNMPKSQQVLLAIIIFIFLLEIILTAFFYLFQFPSFQRINNYSWNTYFCISH